MFSQMIIEENIHKIKPNNGATIRTGTNVHNALKKYAPINTAG